MFSRLGFKDFCETVDIIVGEKLGLTYDVKLIKVNKGKGNKLTGLCIREGNSGLGLTVYLDDYFKEYEDGQREFNDIIYDILQYYKVNNKEILNSDKDYIWNTVKPFVTLRLLNYDMNKELLQGVPHKIVFKDLVVIFYILIGNNTNDEIKSYRINNELFNRFGVTINELYECALQNTTAYFTADLRNMFEVMVNIDTDEETEDNEYTELFDTTTSEEGMGMMYILTNSISNYGATTMLYHDIIKEFADTMGSDIYILPSSIHEVIIFLDYGLEYNVDRLKEMVRDVNEQLYNKDDILSDSVYKYSRATDKIERL